MTSDYVIVAIKLCPEAGNDEWFVLCNFIGCSISSFEVIGEGCGGGGPLEAFGQEKRKKNRYK